MRKLPFSLYLAPILAFFLTMLGFLGFLHLQRRQAQVMASHHLQHLAQETADQLQSHIALHLKLVQLLERFVADQPEVELNRQFRSLATALSQDYSSLMGAMTLDKQGVALLGSPAAFHDYYHLKNFSLDAQGSSLLYQAELSERLVIGQNLVKLGDRTAVIAFQACFDNFGGLKGYLFAAFDVDKLFEPLLQKHGFVSLEISDGQHILWSSQLDNASLTSTVRNFQVANRVWQLKAMASPEQVLADQGNDRQMLSYGFMLALGVSILVYLLLLKQHTHQKFKRRLAVLISNLPGMAYRLENQRTRVMTFVSQGSLELTGFHPEQLVGKHGISFNEVIDQRDIENVSKTVSKAILAKKTYRITYRILTADQHEKWVWESGCGVFDSQGQLQAIEGFICDVSDRVRAETALRQSRDQLEATVALRTEALETANTQLNQEILQRRHTEGQLQVLLANLERANQDLEEFARITSHDLKAPLRGMRDLLTWLREDLDDRLAPKEADAFGQLQSSVQRMALLIDGILRYSRIGFGTPKLQTLQTQAVIEDVLRTLQPASCHRIEVANTLPSVQYDPTQLHQVLQNLIANALQHTPQQGGVISIFSDEQPPFWRLHVKDNGNGIEPEHLEHIFKLFAIVGTDSEQTSGIGLAIVKKIVEHNGGSVAVQSQPGKGTTFTVTIPQRRTEFSTRQKLQILVFDHNRDFARITAKVLEREGHFCHIAADASEALEILKAHSQGLDVVLLDADYNPEYSIQIYDIIRSRYAHLRIIAVTGSKEPSPTLGEVYDGILFKPFELDELFEVLAPAVQALAKQAT